MRILTKFNDIVEWLFMAVTRLMLLVLLGSVFFQVLSRNFLHIPVIWVEEVALTCFVWCIMLGAAVVVRRQEHFDIELIPDRFLRVNRVLLLASYAIQLGISVVLATQGTAFVRMSMRRLTGNLGISRGFIDSSLPIAGVAMVFFILELLIASFQNVKADTDVAQPGGACE
ncbi:MAG: TRAP transporter small permease [Spirochaetaceae bacterium]|nr:MAG: TRAP transporter small permease [Spirochaetaceae bacterium]